MKLATSLLVAALALAPAVAFAKDKTTTTPTTTTSTTTTTKTTSTGSIQSKVDINTASESDLTTLFSKYESKTKADETAKAVIGGRTYGSTKDLLSKKIVSAKLYNSVKSKITAQ